MAEVFISYAAEDRDRARQLATSLESLNWTVWWDRKLLYGQDFGEIIERELKIAKAVVVLWSANSVSSNWVKNEASFADERSILVPVLIEHVALPIQFRHYHTADLVAWNGAASSSSFRELCEALRQITQKPHIQSTSNSPDANPFPAGTLQLRPARLMALIAAASAIVIVIPLAKSCSQKLSGPQRVTAASPYVGNEKALPPYKTTSEVQSGKGGFFNGCPQPQEVEISICRGYKGEYGSVSFRLRQNETYVQQVEKGSTFRYACDGAVDKTCPSNGGYIPLIGD